MSSEVKQPSRFIIGDIVDYMGIHCIVTDEYFSETLQADCIIITEMPRRLDDRKSTPLRFYLLVDGRIDFYFHKPAITLLERTYNTFPRVFSRYVDPNDIINLMDGKKNYSSFLLNKNKEFHWNEEIEIVIHLPIVVNGEMVEGFFNSTQYYKDLLTYGKKPSTTEKVDRISF